jgi:ATP-dependent exoDNAse (exonuclease V) beta subunit
LTSGVVDLMFDGETGWSIVDYKTDVSLDKTVYEKQLAAYTAALRMAGCRVADASVVSARPEP